MTIKTVVKGVLFSLISMNVALYGAESKLSLKSYLNQVASEHQGIKASKQTQDGAAFTSKQSALYTSPTFFADGNLSTDGKPLGIPITGIPSFRTDTFGGDVGLKLKTDWGSQFTLKYMASGTNYTNLDKYYETSPVFEFTKNLWKNADGQDIKVSQQTVVLTAATSLLSETSKIKNVLSDAELAYWRLQLANETVDANKRSLERAEKMLSWAANRANLQLSDNSDYYQAQSAVELRKIELQSSYDEQKLALRAFNILRNEPDNYAADTLTELEDSVLKDLDIPTQFKPKEDVKLLELSKKQSELKLMSTRQELTPSLDFTGKVILNQKEQNFDTAVYNSFSNHYGTYQVSLAFSMNLDVDSIQTVLKGHELQQSALDLAYNRKVIEQENDWNDLNQRLSDAKRKYKALKKLEDIQRNKWVYEMDRRQKGRTTTFQVLQFEQDYASAKLNTLKSLHDVLKIATQLRMYGSN